MSGGGPRARKGRPERLRREEDMFKRQGFRGLIGVAAIGALVLSGGAASAQSGDPILIGVTLDAAKQASYYSLLQKDAMDTCASDINAAGGVLGRPLKLLFEDDENNP